MDATCRTREAESAQAGGRHTAALPQHQRVRAVSSLSPSAGGAGLSWMMLSEVSWLGAHQTSAASSGLSASDREGTHWVSGEGTACPVAAMGNSAPGRCSGPPDGCGGGGQRRFQAPFRPLFSHGERKISVLDTDYSSYMIFCMEGPTPTDEGSMMCQCLGMWGPCRACPEGLRLTET